MCTWMHDKKDGCIDCTLHHDGLCKGPWDYKTDDCRIWELLLERITKWAEEHPEPVYPTWWKYMCMIGVIPSELGDKTLGEATVYNLMNTRIQSDIAEKLGIKPEESV